MSKVKKIYECSKCGAQVAAWEGRCRECGSWGTLQETQIANQKSQTEDNYEPLSAGEIVDFSQVEGRAVSRIKLNELEIDRVLGGGLVPGSLILIGGDPGIGKSTLVLKIADLLSRQNKSLFYISGEESAEQVKLRVDRLKVDTKNLKFVQAAQIERLKSTVVKLKPDVVVLDSIQTVTSAEASGEAGSLSQVRAVTAKLMEIAKQQNITAIIIGHVTKEGQVAGPKTLEHLVDTVLYLEGDKLQSVRILRAVKNRFGDASEVGLFTMTKSGLESVADPAGLFVSQTAREPLKGTALSVVWEGSRAFVVELQALVSRTSFGYPKRNVTGMNLNRVQLLLAVLTQQAKVNLSADDVFVNLAGGLKSDDPALDLAVSLAIVSAKKNKALPQGLVVMGEVSLTGEIKEVIHFDKRLKESVNLGFKKIICPLTKQKLVSQKADIIPVENIKTAIAKAGLI